MTLSATTGRRRPENCEGSIDYVRVLKELQGYSGWVVVEAEQDPVKADPAVYSKLGHANLSRFIKEAGLV